MTRSTSRRPLAAASLGLAAFALAAGAPARTHVATGSIAGAIGNEPGVTNSVDFARIRGRIAIVARTSDGAPAGHSSYGKIVSTAGALPRLPYRIDGLPLGVALTVTIAPVPVAHATPFPQGFFLLSQLRTTDGAPGTTGYALTLDAAHPNATGRDFTYGFIEVPPALPMTHPTPTPTP